MNSARPLSRRASFELTFFFSSAFSASSFSFYASAPNHTPTFLRFSRSSFHLAKVSGVTGVRPVCGSFARYASAPRPSPTSASMFSSRMKLLSSARSVSRSAASASRSARLLYT